MVRTGKEIGVELEVSTDSISGNLNFVDPNYDLLGNSLNYSLSSTKNDKPDQGYENSIISAGIGTKFEQYKDLFTSLALFATHDDLRTRLCIQLIKKQRVNFLNYQVNIVSVMIRETESFNLQTALF